MKKFGLLLTILLVLIFGNGFAQVTANTDLDVSAEVLNSMAASVVNSLDFGTVTAGDTETVSKDDPNVGIVEFTFSAGADVQISAPSSVNLEDEDENGGANIPVTLNFAGNTTNNGSAAADLPFNSGNESLTGGDVSTGTYFLFVGGEMTIPGQQVPSNYSGSVTVTIEYL